MPRFRPQSSTMRLRAEKHLSMPSDSRPYKTLHSGRRKSTNAERNLMKMPRSKNIIIYTTASLPIYLMLATGGAYYPENPSIGIYVFTATIILSLSGLLLLPPNKSKISVSTYNYTVLFFIFAILISATINSTNYQYALYKIENLITPSAIIVLIGAIRAKRLESVLRGYTYVAFAILLITIAYKLNYGFLDRQVRFFINGPIVFGWLMAVAMILSLSVKGTPTYKKALLSASFLAAIIWSESKGPLLAAIFSILLYGYQRSIIKTIVFVPLIATLAIYFSAELGVFQRAQALVRLVTGSLSDVDTGSVIARQSMIHQTVDLILANPVLGVGLGDWSTKIRIPVGTGFALYPHNLLLELFAETGLLRGSLIITALWAIAAKASRRFLPVIAVVIVASMFSGDLAYGRFILFAVMIGFIDSARFRVR